MLFLKPANLAGDYNLNGTVDAADYTLWRDTLGAIVTPFSGADGSGNGVVDQADYDVWKAHFGQTANNLPGDFNHNNVVDAADYTVWRDALGSATDLRANGDDTGPSAGVIDHADYDLWKTHFGQTLSGSGSGSAAGLDASASLQSVAASDRVTASQPPALLRATQRWHRASHRRAPGENPRITSRCRSPSEALLLTRLLPRFDGIAHSWCGSPRTSRENSVTTMLKWMASSMFDESMMEWPMHCEIRSSRRLMKCSRCCRKFAPLGPINPSACEIRRILIDFESLRAATSISLSRRRLCLRNPGSHSFAPAAQLLSRGDTKLCDQAHLTVPLSPFSPRLGCRSGGLPSDL